jgi:peroxiredoxin
MLFMKRIIGFAIIALSYNQTVYAQSKKAMDPQSYMLMIDVSTIKPEPATVYFTYFYTTSNGIGSKSDSLEVINGRAVAKGRVAEPSLAVLQTKLGGESGKFMLAPGVIKVKAQGNISSIEIPDSPYQKDLESLYKQRDEYQRNVLIPIATAYQSLVNKRDSVAAKAKFAEFAVAQQHSNDMWKNYAINYAKKSALSVFALKFASDAGVQGIDSIFNLLAPAYKKTPTAISIKAKIDKEHLVSIGQPAPLFTQPDTLGNPISLAAYKGKYVLLDFWASWCHPCREESPYLISAYRKFHMKNFEILSVSLDSESGKSSWLKAIHDDKVAGWAQVSDLKGWKNAASTLYGINSIPQNYLVDPSGKIIASNLRGAELDQKLTEIFDKL